MATIILLDAKNAMFRFGWAFKTLRAGDGKYTGACYGILKLLLRLKRRFPDGKFVLVWDGPGKSWRHEYWDGYKANRVKDGPIADGVKRILAQIPTVEQLAQLLAIPQLKVNGLEGDDAIALLTHRLVTKNKVVIHSSDRDFIQLMALGVKVIQNAEEPVNEGWVNLKFRCKPEKVVLVRALSGDKSDGIPGLIDGVGVVRAAQMIDAGLNPSFSDFDMHEFSVQRNFTHMKNIWEQVHRNYRLMRLLNFSLLPKTCNEDMCTEIHRGIDKVVTDLSKLRTTTDNYRKFLELAGSMDMIEAIGDRYDLFMLQSLS